jgi:membrane protein
MAAYAPSLQMRVVRRADVPGAAFQLAIEILQRLADARVAAPHGLDIGELATSLRADPLQVEPLLDTLAGIGWTARLDDAGGGRHVLLADLASAPAAPLIAALLLEPAAEVDRFWREARFDRLTVRQLTGSA